MELKDLKEKSNYVLISDINISKDGDYFTLKKSEIISCESILKNEFMVLYSFLYISDSNICETMRFTNASIDGLLRVIEPYFINKDKTNDVEKELKIEDLQLNGEYKVLADVTIITNNEGYFVLIQGELLQLVGVCHINNTFEFKLHSCRYRNKLISEIVVGKKELESRLLPSLTSKEPTNKPQEITPTKPVIISDVLDYHKFYNIPSEIKLISTKIKVIFKELNNGLNEEELIDKGVHFGHAIYTTNTIELQIPRFKIIQYDVKHTYYHELLHWIFYVMGKINLNDDEGFIDLTSNLLLQAMEG